MDRHRRRHSVTEQREEKKSFSGWRVVVQHRGKQHTHTQKKNSRLVTATAAESRSTRPHVSKSKRDKTPPLFSPLLQRITHAHNNSTRLRFELLMQHFDKNKSTMCAHKHTQRQSRAGQGKTIYLRQRSPRRRRRRWRRRWRLAEIVVVSV